MKTCNNWRPLLLTKMDATFLTLYSFQAAHRSLIQHTFRSTVSFLPFFGFFLRNSAHKRNSPGYSDIIRLKLGIGQGKYQHAADRTGLNTTSSQENPAPAFCSKEDHWLSHIWHIPAANKPDARFTRWIRRFQQSSCFTR